MKCFITLDFLLNYRDGNLFPFTGQNLPSYFSAVQAAAHEWRLIARVLDRLCLLTFFIIIIIGSIVVLPK